MQNYGENQLAYPNKPPLEPQSINTEGVTGVGEITSRTMREAVTEVDITSALASGATQAYQHISRWCEERIAAAGPYDDMRALQELILILGDKIREVHSRATAGE